MTCLLVDQGNSRIKYAWRSEQGIDRVSVTEDVDSLSRIVVDRPGVVWLSSVVGAERRKRLQANLRRLSPGGVKLASVLTHRQHLPTHYVPEQLGVDRWLAMLACRKRPEPRLLVVDSGTATTIDLLDAEQGHLGGFILPGFALMQQALLGATAIQPATSGSDTQRLLPCDTRSAIADAGPLAVASLIEHLRQKWGGDMLVVLAGGAAPQIQMLLDGPVERVEHLVLSGLAVLSRLEGD